MEGTVITLSIVIILFLLAGVSYLIYRDRKNRWLPIRDPFGEAALRKARREKELADLDEAVTLANTLSSLYYDRKTARKKEREARISYDMRKVCGKEEDEEVKQAKESWKKAEKNLTDTEELVRLHEKLARDLYPKYFYWL